jgi:PITH domain
MVCVSCSCACVCCLLVCLFACMCVCVCVCVFVCGSLCLSFVKSSSSTRVQSLTPSPLSALLSLSLQPLSPTPLSPTPLSPTPLIGLRACVRRRVFLFPVSGSPLKFSSVNSITLFISENFGDEQTTVYHIGLRGQFLKVRRELGELVYELAPNPKDHKVEGSSYGATQNIF